MKLKLDPTRRLLALLIVMSILAGAFNFSSHLLLHLVATAGFAVVLYWFYTLISAKHKKIDNTLITAFIIFLVLNFGDAAGDLLYPLLATFIAITWKFFIEVRKSPVINPAVIGLLLMATMVSLIPGLEDPFVSWWGASFKGELSLALLILWMITGVHSWRKWPAVLSFLGAHILLLIFRGESWEFIRFTFLDSTIYFFAAIMLIDPRSSPLRNRDQFFFGLVAALAYNFFLQYGVPYFSLFAIATANLANILLRPRKKKKLNTGT